MKTLTRVAPGLLLSAFCFQALAQPSIDWAKIAGGGGTSSGGVYTLSGTSGQPDAGWMSGGSFTLEGGFWGSLAAIQTPNAPLLSITVSDNTVIVSWPTPADGWLLEQTNRLTALPGPWLRGPFPYVTNAADIRVTLPAAPGNLFFRLYKP